MRTTSLILFVTGCATTAAIDDTADLDGGVHKDASADTTVTDTGTGNDAAADSGDSATDDASDASDDADDGSIILDAGPDGSCPPCVKGFSCCMVMKSINYGKCTDNKCLACCQ